MGNELSKNTGTEKRTLKETVDYIATNYILTHNFRDMKNLSDAKYCDKLVILTAKVIASNLNDLEVEYLGQRMKGTKEVNFAAKDRMIYFKKSEIDDLDIKNKTKKRRVCLGIAKFYVKIAHLFAAIIKTINPVYIYKTDTGVTERVSFRYKDKIPKGKDFTVSTDNICDNRINILSNNNNYDVPGNTVVKVSPTICGMNANKNLSDEPGIPELEMLYYDKYDDNRGGVTTPLSLEKSSSISSSEQIPQVPSPQVPSEQVPSEQVPSEQISSATQVSTAPSIQQKTKNLIANTMADVDTTWGKLTDMFSGQQPSSSPKWVGSGGNGKYGFTAMSEDAKKIYQKNLETFYNVFVGGPIPIGADGNPMITKFSQIPLRQYGKSEKCQSSGLYKKTYASTRSDDLFAQYASHLKEMMNNTKDKRNKLIAILEQMFVSQKDSKTQKNEIIINPNLTEVSLQLLVDEARKIIITVYLGCEKDFIEGLKLFDAIIEKTSQENVLRELKELSNPLDELFVDGTDYDTRTVSGSGSDIDGSAAPDIDDSAAADAAAVAASVTNAAPAVAPASVLAPASVERQLGTEPATTRTLGTAPTTALVTESDNATSLR